jgi:hypothetical protein
MVKVVVALKTACRWKGYGSFRKSDQRWKSMRKSNVVFYSASAVKVLCLVIGLLMTVALTSCERPMTIRMNTSNPPTFNLAGSGRLFFFSVFEVPQGRPPSVDDPKMWEIRPTQENLISKLPPITYGVIPPGFQQTIPATGPPPAMVEGKIYEAGGPALEADGGWIRFKIKDGKAVEVSENK